MKKVVFAICTMLFCVTFIAKAQKEVLVVGRVLDEKNTTLPGANLYAYSSKRGTTTDKSGFFKIVVSNPDSLRISFIGYKTKIEVIPFIDPVVAVDTLITLNIYLERSSVSLKEAVISAKKKPELLYGFDGKVNQWIYDYETQDDKIWLLIQRGSRRTLVIINNSGDTLVNKQLHFKPKAITKDAYGTIILLTDERAFLASYEKRIFKLYRELNLFEYNQFVKPVIAGNKEVYFFRTDNFENGTVNYFQFAFKERPYQDSLFYSYSVVNQLANIMEENRRIKLNTAFGSSERQNLVAFNSIQMAQFRPPNVVRVSMTREENPDVFEDLSMIEVVRELDPSTRRDLREFNALFTDAIVPMAFRLPSTFNPEVTGWFSKLLMKEKFCPLFLHNDTVYVFNHEVDSLHLFKTTGERISTSYITYSNPNEKKREILIDRVTGKFYYKHLANGLVHLKEIDVMTGNSVRNYVIEEMTFPEKVDVNDGAIFYLHKMKNEAGKRLYRLPLN
jgi:hypothetical protein